MGSALAVYYGGRLMTQAHVVHNAQGGKRSGV